jgi:TonB family protein
MIEKSLVEGLSKSGQAAIVERSMVQSALAGVSYDGSINMSLLEARRLGSAIGCDFFIIGKAEVVTRSESVNQTHHEAIVGVMIVDGRSGKLALFDLVTAKAGSPDTALNLLSQSLARRASRYLEEIREFSSARMLIAPTRTDGPAEPIEDLPIEGSPRSIGFTAPEFLNRVKPEYTAEAERADISASVEANAVLRSNGEIGEIEILRWAGFGLDEAAEKAIRQLQFKPATRNGQPVSVRALIRYNFRRVGPAAPGRR